MLRSRTQDGLHLEASFRRRRGREILVSCLLSRTTSVPGLGEPVGRHEGAKGDTRHGAPSDFIPGTQMMTSCNRQGTSVSRPREGTFDGLSNTFKFKQDGERRLRGAQ